MFLRIARNMALQYQMKPQEKAVVANGFVEVRKEGGTLCSHVHMMMLHVCTAEGW